MSSFVRCPPHPSQRIEDYSQIILEINLFMVQVTDFDSVFAN